MGVIDQVRSIDLTSRLRQLAWASLVANIFIVVSGGVVRLTGSGLGCPTWPRCTAKSFTPHDSLSVHSAIEFSNRMLTYVLVAIAVATLVAAFQSGRRELKRIALILALGIPLQAVVGGVSVLTHLNPWVVSFHLLASMAMIGVAVLFLRLVDRDGPLSEARAAKPVTALTWTMFATGWAVLYVGTVVTGAGPHAGDKKAPRNGLDPLQLSQLHADLVFLFVGLTIGLFFVLVATGASAEARQAATLLLVVELAQGAIGFVQYFTGVPAVLVGFHMLGAALISAAMTWAVLTTREG